MSALEEIAAERRRQIEVEGWTPAHDDKHSKGELVRAAVNYLAAVCVTAALGARNFGAAPPLSGLGLSIDWPWDRAWWKPGAMRRMLIKAGALIVAEIERLDRSASTAPVEPSPGPRVTLTDGSPVTADHRELRPDGQQKGYVVLSEAERAKGFIRPVRRSYRHLKCSVVTTMGQALAETYARDPNFCSGTYCAGCREHFPVGDGGEFVWDGTSEKVGT